MASRTAAAQAAGSGSSHSMTELVMNQPTESSQRCGRSGSWRECTGSTARSPTPARRRSTSVISATASAIIRTPPAAAAASSAATPSGSSTSRTSTTCSRGAEMSPRFKGKTGIPPAPRSMIPAHFSCTRAGAGGRAASSAVCSANGAAGGRRAAGSRPRARSSRPEQRSRITTSSDHASTWLWSNPITTTGRSRGSVGCTRHSACAGRANGLHASSKTRRTTALGSSPGPVRGTRQPSGCTVTGRRRSSSSTSSSSPPP